MAGTSPAMTRVESVVRLQPLAKTFDIDKTAGMAALTDAAFLVESLDLEADQAPLHCDHARGGAHRYADRRGGKMANIDLGADRDPTRLKKGIDGVAGDKLHLQDHHRRRIHHRHASNEM